MKGLFAVVRVPRKAQRAVRKRLRELAHDLSWAALDPVNDVPLIVARVAEICDAIARAAVAERLESMEKRITVLRQSSDRADLVAAAELQDFLDEARSEDEE